MRQSNDRSQFKRMAWKKLSTLFPQTSFKRGYCRITNIPFRNVNRWHKTVIAKPNKTRLARINSSTDFENCTSYRAPQGKAPAWGDRGLRTEGWVLDVRGRPFRSPH